MDAHGEEKQNRKKLDLFLILALAALLLLGAFLGIWSACNVFNQVPREVASVYQEYLERMKDGIDAQLIQDLCHYEDQFMMEAMLLSTERVTTYQVVGWRQFSDKLWAVVADTSTDLVPEKQRVVNFVGLIGNKYRFIINTTQMPKDLKKNLPVDLQPYEDYMMDPDQYEKLISLILSLE